MPKGLLFKDIDIKSSACNICLYGFCAFDKLLISNLILKNIRFSMLR